MIPWPGYPDKGPCGLSSYAAMKGTSKLVSLIGLWSSLAVELQLLTAWEDGEEDLQGTQEEAYHGPCQAYHP